MRIKTSPHGHFLTREASDDHTADPMADYWKMWPHSLPVDLGLLCPADLAVARTPQDAKDWIAEFQGLAHATAVRLLRDTENTSSTDVERVALYLGPQVDNAARGLWWLLAPPALRAPLTRAGLSTITSSPPTGVEPFKWCVYVLHRTGWGIKDLPPDAPAVWLAIRDSWTKLYGLADRAENGPTDKIRRSAAADFAVELINVNMRANTR